jgi:hypothetical protein
MSSNQIFSIVYLFVSDIGFCFSDALLMEIRNIEKKIIYVFSICTITLVVSVKDTMVMKLEIIVKNMIFIRPYPPTVDMVYCFYYSPSPMAQGPVVFDTFLLNCSMQKANFPL